jgi:hypothetical protein
MVIYAGKPRVLFLFLMGIIMEYPETCGFSPSDGKIGC